MPIIAKKTGGGDFIPCPPGTWSAVCCDVVDLGLLEVTFGGKKKKQHKIYISWQIEEARADNKPHMISKRYTLSLHEKAALRKDLEAWRGRPFTDDELEGFDVEAVVGVACYIAAVKSGEYTNVASIMKLPRGVPSLVVRDYIRKKDRKDEAIGESHEQPFGDISDEDVPF